MSQSSSRDVVGQLKLMCVRIPGKWTNTKVFIQKNHVNSLGQLGRPSYQVMEHEYFNPPVAMLQRLRVYPPVNPGWLTGILAGTVNGTQFLSWSAEKSIFGCSPLPISDKCCSIAGLTHIPPGCGSGYSLEHAGISWMIRSLTFRWGMPYMNPLPVMKKAQKDLVDSRKSELWLDTTSHWPRDATSINHNSSAITNN